MKKNPSSGRCFNPRTPCGVRLRSMKPVPRPGRFQSTHSLRSATDCPSFERCIDAVSIHALLAECDLRTKGNYYVITKVSIHALLAECDLYSSPSRTSFSVSIHALLAECDRTTTNLDWLFTGFNPRTPCGVRLFASCRFRMPSGCFNPRTPCGVRPDLAGKIDTVRQFQSTHSLRSATRLPLPGRQRASVSIHALLAECDKIKGHSVTC